jgi:multidrug efflux pump subunit AcrB
VPLTQLGGIDYTVAETEIRRKDKERMVEVSANIAQGTLGEAKQAMQQLIDEKIDLPAGYTFTSAASRNSWKKPSPKS